ncbi:hypothetical protein [Paenibacillus hunanensis]|uniref:Uncharacterized protein n=1 Tax=Paenibacillus hunanensis TaxID=539262 RepID=A0ABU1IW09_9BACL|nr:hypothetical protein [Paenibacillus hunanensis]MDR6243430.1 hypothetical protein [Paenibacillus hunanensis]GGI97641.1 hypothetical protein GCM10008022_02950 [Paenibacillus hunanensis]
MKTKPRLYRLGTGLLTAILGITIAMPSFAAQADSLTTLKSASWSTPLFSATDHPDLSEVNDIKVIPSQSLVYVKASHVEQNAHATSSTSDTNTHEIDTFNAYSTKDGKLEWSYTNLGEPGDTGVTQYANNGTVYFCNRYADGHYRLTSLNPTGKVNWTVKLPAMANAFPYDLSLMQDGSLLVSVAVHTDSQGNVQSMLKRYDANGKLLQQKVVNGYVMAASGKRIIVDASIYKNNDTQLKNAKVDVYGLQLNSIYNHRAILEFDHYDDQIAVLNDGTVLIGTYKPDEGNRFIRFDANGKITGTQAVSDDYQLQSTDSGYILYDHNIFKWYRSSSQKPVASTTLKGSPGDTSWIQHTSDGNLLITMLDRTYILNPTTHAIIAAWHRTSSDLTFDYADHAVYTNQGQGTLSKYVVQK